MTTDNQADKLRNFSVNLLNLRAEKKLTQHKLGTLAGISPQMIRKYEQGAILPMKATLVRLAKALCVTPDSLYTPVVVHLTEKQCTPSRPRSNVLAHAAAQYADISLSSDAFCTILRNALMAPAYYGVVVKEMQALVTKAGFELGLTFHARQVRYKLHVLPSWSRMERSNKVQPTITALVEALIPGLQQFNVRVLVLLDTNALNYISNNTQRMRSMLLPQTVANQLLGERAPENA